MSRVSAAILAGATRPADVVASTRTATAVRSAMRPAAEEPSAAARVARACSRAASCPSASCAGGRRGLGAEREQVAAAPHRVRDLGRERSALRNQPSSGSRRPSRSEARSDDSGDAEAADGYGRERRTEWQEQCRDEGCRRRRGEARAEDADGKALERGHVRHRPAEHVSCARVDESRRGERHEPTEEPDARSLEQAQRGVVRDEALEVAKGGAADPERADAHDRDLQGRDRRVLRRPREQPRGGAHEADAAGGRERAERRRREHAPDLRTNEVEEGTAAHAASSAAATRRR